MKFLKPWKESFKHWSQWVNVAIAALGTVYVSLSQEIRNDLPDVIVHLMAGAAALNVFIRNLAQGSKSDAEEVSEN